MASTSIRRKCRTSTAFQAKSRGSPPAVQASGRNQFAAGAALDRGSVDYTQNTDYAYVNPNYTLTSVPAWQDGSTRADGCPSIRA